MNPPRLQGRSGERDGAGDEKEQGECNLIAGAAVFPSALGTRAGFLENSIMETKESCIKLGSIRSTSNHFEGSNDLLVPPWLFDLICNLCKSTGKEMSIYGIRVHVNSLMPENFIGVKYQDDQIEFYEIKKKESLG